jgi:SpoVK/Ycf46/Vps4 family AAA+-type ATPase
LLFPFSSYSFVGKTSLILGLAKRLQFPVLMIKPSSLLRKYVGETSQLTNAIFTLSKKLKSCIIYIDEMDALFRKRDLFEHHVDRNFITECIFLGSFVIVCFLNRLSLFL